MADVPDAVPDTLTNTIRGFAANVAADLALGLGSAAGPEPADGRMPHLCKIVQVMHLLGVTDKRVLEDEFEETMGAYRRPAVGDAAERINRAFAMADPVDIEAAARFVGAFRASVEAEAGRLLNVVRAAVGALDGHFALGDAWTSNDLERIANEYVGTPKASEASEDTGDESEAGESEASESEESDSFIVPDDDNGDSEVARDDARLDALGSRSDSSTSEHERAPPTRRWARPEDLEPEFREPKRMRGASQSPAGGSADGSEGGPGA